MTRAPARVVVRAGFPFRIYDGAPEPSLGSSDAAWAQTFAPQKG
jgi:hypothetical protein